jgi:mono/diheme cytochrome c family protein
MSSRLLCSLLPTFLIAAFLTAATAFASGEGTDAARHAKARALFLDACTACHTLERVRSQRLGKEEWRQLIAGMLSEGVPLTDEETSLLVDYLAENFGPEKQ